MVTPNADLTDASYYQRRLWVARMASELPASAQFDLARSDLSDTELHQVVQQFGASPMEGHGLANGLNTLMATEPQKIPVADLKTFQSRLKQQGFAPSTAPVDGIWNSEWGAAATHWDYEARTRSQAGYNGLSVAIPDAMRFITNTMPSNVFQAIVGSAKETIVSTPKHAESLGLAGGTLAGAAIGTAIAPGVGTVVGGVIGGVTGFLADVLTHDSSEPVHQSVTQKLIDALGPKEEWGHTYDGKTGVQHFWDDLGWVGNAASLAWGAGEVGGAVTAAKGIFTAGAAAATDAASAAGEAAPGLLQKLASTTSSEPGWFGRLASRAAAKPWAPEWAPSVIKATRVLRGASGIASEVYTPFAAASMGARYTAGLWSGDATTTDAEKAIKTGPTPEKAFGIPHLDGVLDNTLGMLVVPKQFLPFKLGDVAKGAETLMGSESTLKPMAEYFARQTNTGIGDAVSQAKAFLGQNDIERTLTFHQYQLRAGVDEMVRNELATADDAALWSSDRAAVYDQRVGEVMDKINRGDVGTAKEALSWVTGREAPRMEAWMHRNFPTLDALNADRELNTVSHEVNAQIKDGKLQIAGVGEGQTIRPAPVAAPTQQSTEAMASRYEDLRNRILTARKTGNPAAEDVARMEMADLMGQAQEAELLPDEVIAKSAQTRPTLGPAQSLRRFGKSLPAEAELPGDLGAMYLDKGYKPVVANHYWQLDNALETADNLPVADYSRMSRVVDSAGLGFVRNSDRSLMKLRTQMEVNELQNVSEKLGMVDGEGNLLDGEALRGKLLGQVQRINEDTTRSRQVANISIHRKILDPRQLSAADLGDAFEEYGGLDANQLKLVQSAVHRGAAFGIDADLKDLGTVMHQLGHSMRWNGLPGFTDLMRAQHFQHRVTPVLLGAAGGAAVGGIEGDSFDDVVKGAMQGGAVGLAASIAAFAHNGNGYLPDRLAKLVMGLRYTLSPTFDMGRYMEQNAMALMSKDRVPLMLRPQKYIKDAGRVFDSPYGQVQGDEAWKAAVHLHDELFGNRHWMRGISDLDQYTNQIGVFGFSPRDFEAAQALALWDRGQRDMGALRETIGKMGRYGTGRTAFEKSANFVFFPLSYTKKLVTTAGDFFLHEPARAAVLSDLMATYYGMKFDKDFHQLVEDHAPLMKQLAKVSNFGVYGLTPGRFFLKGLSEHESGTGKALQLLASILIPGGYAGTFAQTTGDAGDIWAHGFIPHVLTGYDMNRAGGVQGVMELMSQYAPFVRDFEQYKTAALDQYRVLAGGSHEDLHAQQNDYAEGLRQLNAKYDDMAYAMGYSGGRGSLWGSSTGMYFRDDYDKALFALRDKYPDGFALMSNFSDKAGQNAQALTDLSQLSPVQRTKGENAILRIQAMVGEADQFAAAAGITQEMAAQIAAPQIRAEALRHIGDPNFVGLWDRFYKYQYGPIVAAELPSAKETVTV